MIKKKKKIVKLQRDPPEADRLPFLLNGVIRDDSVKGFTLFELLVSISIIGIMVALAVVSYSAAQRKARDARRIQDMKAIQTAAEQYYSLSNYNYPGSYSGGDSWIADGVTILASFPSDPKGGVYSYSCSGGGVDLYCCCAEMENNLAGNSNGSCGFGVAATYFCVQGRQ